MQLGALEQILNEKIKNILFRILKNKKNIWNVKKNVIRFPCIKRKKTTGVLCELSSRRTSGFNFLSAVKFGLKFTLSKSPTQFQPQVTTTSKFDFLKINPYDSLFMFTIQCRCNAIQTQTCFFSNSRPTWIILLLWKYCQYCRPKSLFFFKAKSSSDEIGWLKRSKK